MTRSIRAAAIIGPVILGLSLSTICHVAQGAKPKGPDMEVDDPGSVRITLIVNRAGWAQPLKFERLRQPIGEFTEQSKLGMEKWETSYYLAKYDRIAPPSAKSHCAGQVMRFLSQYWRQSPETPLFPYTKMDTDVLTDILQALDVPKETTSTPEAGDVIFWSKKDIKDLGGRQANNIRGGDQHYAHIHATLPNGNFIMESKDGDQSTFHVEMPADPNTLMKGWGLAKWTDDTLLNTYEAAHRYRLHTLTDLNVTWRYWIPQSVNLAGYWADQADPEKIYRVYQPRPAFAERKLPMQIIQAFGEKKRLRAGFESDTQFFAQEFGAKEDATPRRMAQFTKDKIEWLGPPPGPGSKKSYRDVIGTWVRLQPYLALSKVERWVETHNSKSCGAVGTEKVSLKASSGNVDICYEARWEGGFKRTEGGVFYDFSPGLRFEKDGYSNMATIQVSANIMKANFTGAGLGIPHPAMLWLNAEEDLGNGASRSLEGGHAKGQPRECGNYLTSLDPIDITATYTAKAMEIGDSVAIEVIATFDRQTDYGPAVKVHLRGVYEVVGGPGDVQNLGTGGGTVDAFTPKTPAQPRQGRDPHKYSQAKILSVKNAQSIQIRLSPKSKKVTLDGSSKEIPEYAEIFVGQGAEIVLGMVDPQNPDRIVRITFREYTEGRLSELWPNAEFDRAEVSFDRGVLDVDANGLGSGSFRVSSPTTKVDVTGTRFRAEHDPQTQTTRVDVKEGSVVATPTNSSLTPVTLSAGQQVDVGAAVVGAIESVGSSPLVSGSDDPGDDGIDDGDNLQTGRDVRTGVDVDLGAGAGGGLPDDYPEDWRSQIPPDAQISGMDDNDPSGGDWAPTELPPDEGEWIEVGDDSVTVIGGPGGEFSEELGEDFPDDFPEGDTGEFYIGDLDKLITMLKSPDPGNHLDAAMAITEMGEDAKGALPELLGLLGHSDSMSRLAGLIGLTGIGPVPEALAALPQILPLLEDTESMIRADAAIYLGELGAVGSALQKSAVVDALRGLLQDPAQEVRDSAEGTLEYISR